MLSTNLPTSKGLPMHIRAFLGAAVLGLAMLAFAPIASADPAPDICVLDLSQPVTIDHALDTADMTCAALAAVEVASAVPIGPGDDDEAAGPCSILTPTAFDLAGHRQHEDPGRCLV
jgi:hypothetical protein